MVPSRFHTVNRLLGWWGRTSISCGSREHDMAYHTRVLCTVQHPSFAAVRGVWAVRRYEPGAVLPLCFRCVVPMV